MNFTIIAAMDANRGIGKNNALPWHLPSDLKHFKETTEGGAVLMGRKTWESIPEKYRPFSGRLNIVISRQKDLDLPEGVLLAGSLDEALSLAEEQEGEAFLIGGAQLFQEAIVHPACERIVLTLIGQNFDCDAFFPAIPAHFSQNKSTPFREENGIEFGLVQLVNLDEPEL